MMADARSRGDWAHTAMLCALIANVNRDPKKGRPYKPADFDPHSQRKVGYDLGTDEGMKKFRELVVQPGTKVTIVKASDMRRQA